MQVLDSELLKVLRIVGGVRYTPSTKRLPHNEPLYQDVPSCYDADSWKDADL